MSIKVEGDEVVIRLSADDHQGIKFRLWRLKGGLESLESPKDLSKSDYEFYYEEGVDYIDEILEILGMRKALKQTTEEYFDLVEAIQFLIKKKIKKDD